MNEGLHLVSLFIDKSTSLGYTKLKPSLKKNSSDSIQQKAGWISESIPP